MSNVTVPASLRSAGVYTSFNRLGAIGDVGPNNRLLIPGQVPASASIPLNTPYLPSGADQVDQLCQSWSHLAHNYKAARSQPQAAGAEMWILPVADPAGGVKATRPLKFMAAPTYDNTDGWIPGSNTTVTQTTQIDIEIGGFGVASFRANAGDTFAVVATAAQAAAALLVDWPVVPTVATDTVTLTDRHAGAIGEDLWIGVRIYNPASGLAVSPGTLTVAAGPAGADGTITLVTGASAGVLQRVVAIVNADTDHASAVKLRNSINGAAWPLRAAVASTGGVVVLYYQNDVHFGRMTATAASIAPQTSTMAAGTTGTGNPDLTAAATALYADQSLAFKAIAQPWQDTGNGSTWAALSAYVLASDAPGIEKGETCHGAFTGGLLMQPSSGIPQAASLSTSELFAVDWAQGVPVRAGEIAARACAIVAAQTNPAKNYNGYALRGNSSKPLPLPHRMYRPTEGPGSQVELGITAYQLAPLTVRDGMLCIALALTTFKSAGSATLKLTKWSGALLPIYFRADLRYMLTAKFMGTPDNGGKSIKSVGNAQTENAATPEGVKAEVVAKIREWGQKDYYDNVEGLISQVQAGVTVTPTRIDVSLPFNGVADLDQIVADGYAAQ